MSLNILGVFEADDFNSDPDDVDNRKGKYRLINALNEYGLYRRGLKGYEITDILTKHFSKKVSANNKEKKEGDIKKIIISHIDDNEPVIIGIDYNKDDGHWIVAVGYKIDDKGNAEALLTLDPGIDSPTYCHWNGILSLNKEERKTYGYSYNTSNNMVDISEIITLSRK
jgi:hypothetical protein